MKTIYKIEGNLATFIMADVDPAYQQALRRLYYLPVEEGFGKSFPADTPNLERIYENFARHAEEMLLQAADARPIPWERALLDFLNLVEGHGIDWWLGGSAALAVRGVDITPHDIDLVADDAGANSLGELLLDYLVEPVLPSEDWIARWFGRSFLHTRLEWVGGVIDEIDQPEPADFGPFAASRLETVRWQGREIRVAPLELQLQTCLRRELFERAEKIRRVMGKLETDPGD